MRWLDNIPFWLVIAGSLTLGLAPFAPEPHLLEKLGFLVAGNLTRPMDIFDLCMHGIFPLLLLLKSIRLLLPVAKHSDAGGSSE